MLIHLNDYPNIKVKQHTPSAGTHQIPSTPRYAWDFEIQESDDTDTYNPHGKTLRHNDINAYVVDWEIPKQENAEQDIGLVGNVGKAKAEAEESDQ